MIHLIHAGNRRLYEPQLAAMHRQRHEHFIAERGWALRERDGGEYDEYDDESAFYLAAFAPDGDVAVSLRLRPTAETSLIADVFPHLIAATEQPVKAPAIYEATRYCAAKPYRGERGFCARSKMHLAILETMLDRRAQRLLGFMDMEFIPYFRKFSGMRLRPIGFPAAYDQGTTLAFDIGITADDLAWGREALHIRTRQLFEAPSWLPSNTDTLALAQATEILISGSADARHDMQETMREQSSRIQLVDDIPSVIAALSKRAA